MRLIDADKIGVSDFELIMCEGSYKELLKMLIDKIDNAPTAFNKEKVIEELEKAECSKSLEATSYRQRAIEIVKRGGVDE